MAPPCSVCIVHMNSSLCDGAILQCVHCAYAQQLVRWRYLALLFLAYKNTSRLNGELFALARLSSISLKSLTLRPGGCCWLRNCSRQQGGSGIKLLNLCTTIHNGVLKKMIITWMFASKSPARKSVFSNCERRRQLKRSCSQVFG